jgi:4'-phosphopantetheinyl transferase
MIRIEVARLRLATDAPTLAAAGAWLVESERERAARFVRAEDRARHLLGRALARRLLARRLDLPADALRFVEDAQGKPMLDAAHGAASFNLSHSGDWVVCAIGDGRALGIDVQERTAAMARPEDFGRVFGPAERARIDAQPGEAARIAAFARAWARKEALVKAVGLGLSLRLEAIDVVDGEHGPCWSMPDDARSAAALDGDWTLRDVPLDERHAGAVAWRGAGGTVETVAVDATTFAPD